VLQIYSNIKPDQLLHIVVSLEDFINSRTDIVPPQNFLQCSALSLVKDKTFKAHKHIWKSGPEKVIAQESWVVIRGRVEGHFYDLDGTLICKKILLQGDASFTLEGGHNYVSLESDTFVYEYKTGPYTGQADDKIFL